MGPVRRGHLRVAMSLVPINPSDLLPITGAYAHRTSLPSFAGYEGVGRVVEASPELADFVGKRVLPLRGEGTWQTVVDCDSAHAVPVPDEVPDDVACRAYINPLTALAMLDRWPVQGRTVMLSGAGSNCAEYLGCWAYERGAEKVFGVYRSESRVQRMKAFGIQPIPMGDSKRILDLAVHTDVTFDALGGRLASAILGKMRAGTNFVGYGLLTGQSVIPPANTKASLRRFHLRDETGDISPVAFTESFARIWPLLLKMKLPEARPWPAKDWQRAVLASSKPGSPKQLLDLASLAI